MYMYIHITPTWATIKSRAHPCCCCSSSTAFACDLTAFARDSNFGRASPPPRSVDEEACPRAPLAEAPQKQGGGKGIGPGAAAAAVGAVCFSSVIKKKRSTRPPLPLLIFLITESSIRALLGTAPRFC